MERKRFLKSLPLIGLGGGMMLAGLYTVGAANIGSEENELEGDARLVQQAAERDAIAVQTYKFVAESGILKTQTVIDTATVYMRHHIGHLEEFNSLLSVLGGEPMALDSFQADKRASDVKTESDVIELAMTLEFEAAHAYFSQMVNELEQLEARRLFGNIYPIELAHYITLKSAHGQSQGPVINAPLFKC